MPPAFSISCPTQVHFGAGKRSELAALLPADTSGLVFLQGKSGVASAPVREVLRKAGYAPHVVQCDGEPSIGSVNAVMDELPGTPIDMVIACGGGAVVDMGKAIAFLAEQGAQARLPQDFSEIARETLRSRRRTRLIILPTTAGTGAEVTANAVIDVPAKQAKISIRGAALTPDHAIIDPDLLDSAPAEVILHSGLDAITQVIEAYTSSAATPFSDALSRPAIPLGLSALTRLMAAKDTQARSDMAWTSLASGLALANAGLGAAHGAASVLGGRYGAPHGALCGRLLIPVLQRNLARTSGPAKARVEGCCAMIAAQFPPVNGGNQTDGMAKWLDGQGLPRLRNWDIPKSDFAQIGAQAAGASSSQKNPVLLTPEDFQAILQEAY